VTFGSPSTRTFLTNVAPGTRPSWRRVVFRVAEMAVRRLCEIQFSMTRLLRGSQFEVTAVTVRIVSVRTEYEVIGWSSFGSLPPAGLWPPSPAPPVACGMMINRCVNRR